MITNEHMETLPSSCSSTSSSCSSSSSSASSANSSSLSTLSSTQGTASSTSNSTSSSPSTSNHHHLNHQNTNMQQQQHHSQANILNKQEQLAFDFHLIMSDLKSVCGTLSVLARQIDQIVSKMDDKFNLIVENLNSQQENEPISKSTSSSNNQRNSKTTTKLSDLIKCANLGSHNEPIYSNSNNTTTTSKLSPNSNPLSYSNKSKSKMYSNPNEALLTSLINENYAAILNTQASNKAVSRTFSDRKPLYFTNHSVNDEIKKNFNFSFNSQLAKHQQQPNVNDDSPQRPSILNATKLNSNTSTLNKTRCIRSKSQPAFAKPESIDYHSFLLNTNVNKIQTITTKNLIDNTINSQDESTNKIESSFYEDQLDNELEGFENSSKQLLTNLSNKFNNKKEDRPPLSSTPAPSSSTTTANINSIINNSINSITDQSSIKTMTPNLKQAGRTKSSNSNHHVSFNLNNAIYSSRQETPVPIPISILKNSSSTQAKLMNQSSDKTDSKYANLSNGPLNLLSFPSSLQSAAAAATTSITNSPMQQQQLQPGSINRKQQSNYANPATILISEQQQQSIQQLAAAAAAVAIDADKLTQPLRSLLNNANSNSNLNSKTVRIDSKTTIL